MYSYCSRVNVFKFLVKKLSYKHQYALRKCMEISQIICMWILGLQGLKEFEELPGVSWVNKLYLYTSKAPHNRSLSSSSELSAKSFIHCFH